MLPKVGKNTGFMSIAQPSRFYWENPGFIRVILGFTGFTYRRKSEYLSIPEK